jgi:DtxR family manganese transport transcriptional regulator
VLEAAQARRFGKNRGPNDLLRCSGITPNSSPTFFAENGEVRATDVAKRLRVTHSTALKSIARLRRKGLLTARPYRGLFLTDAGQKLAEIALARHRLVVDLLIAVGASPEAAEADAEGIKHHVSRPTLKAFECFLAEHKQV